MRRKRGRARSDASNPDAETNGTMCEYFSASPLPLSLAHCPLSRVHRQLILASNQPHHQRTGLAGLSEVPAMLQGPAEHRVFNQQLRCT